MDFWGLPVWAWLLIFAVVWIVLSLLEFFKPAAESGCDAASREYLYENRDRYVFDNTEPGRFIEYSFFGAWHTAEVTAITQVEPGVIAFTDTDGRDFLVYTDEWRVINVPVGLDDYDDER